mmetsp:Transcript_6903/g.16453  ORF Transcript_6903/g.16453 Transcript_6903/m.16453 type:complete len:324 (+) Transcript_6903:187-1158(+)
MGSFLEKPKTEKATERAEGNGLLAGMSDMQGWRVDMEDAHTVMPSIAGWDGFSFFGVYDGHGGSLVSKHVAEHILDEIRSHGGAEAGSTDELSAAWVKAHMSLDAKMRELPSVKGGEDHSGSTSIQAIVSPTHILVANCGDSRAVLSKVGSPMVWGSEDHKPNLEPEQKRIEAAGGSVMNRRVNGDLAVSRAFGDFLYKHREDLPPERQQVSVEPEISVFERAPAHDEFLILCCDGIWDVMSNEDVVGFVRTKHDQGCIDLGQIAEDLLDRCLTGGSRDNMSALIVRFPAAKMPASSVVEAYLAREEERKKAEAAAAAGGASA